MGIALADFEFLHKNILQKVQKDYRQIKILELGNQHLHKDFEIEHETSKQYFDFVGSFHVSIDLNGKDGAIPINLNNLIEDNDFIGSFDIVTNFGTTEHVTNQYMCWTNIHNLCRKGGLFINVVPKNRDWPGHGYYHYKKSFFSSIADMNDYTIIKREINVSRGKGKYLINCSMVKNSDNEFMSKDDFRKVTKESIYKLGKK